MRVTRHTIAPEVLLQAYASGYFPMADPRSGEIEWYTADPRAILPLDPFHIPRRVQRALKRSGFQYTRDRAFEPVMRGCADRQSSWINEGIIRSYSHLHSLGHAHSVEVWRAEELVGGLYGVQLGGAFFGESMFHRADGASKGALVHLAEHLRSRQFQLLEIQMITPLTAQFGGQPIPRRDYMPLLAEAIRKRCSW